MPHPGPLLQAAAAGLTGARSGARHAPDRAAGGRRAVPDYPIMSDWQRQLICSGSPYEPITGFSRAVRAGVWVAVAGTAPIGPHGRTVAPGDAAAQARRCFEIIREALEKAGARLEDVVRTRIMLRRIEDWEAVSRVHGEYFQDIRPACTIVQVTRFVEPDWLVEIEADAVVLDG